MSNTGADWRERLQAPVVQVVKMGGSVLKGRQDYFRAADFVASRLRGKPAERLAVVVSARLGETDELLQMAEEVCPSPEPRTLDLLWTCGEMRSVALMALCLQRLGIPARGLNAHETGLTVPYDGDLAGLRLKREGLLDGLRHCPVVIVPGFFASTCAQTLISLGRGGSDLTALWIADALQAGRCELIKDVAGYFDRDPNRFSHARPLPLLSYRQAIEMARGGCDLVQLQALETACRLGIPLLVRGLEASDPCSWVSDCPQEASGFSPRNPDAGHCFQPAAYSLKPTASLIGRNEK